MDAPEVSEHDLLMICGSEYRMARRLINALLSLSYEAGRLAQVKQDMEKISQEGSA